MAIIYTYPTKATPNVNDLILISDSQDSNKTKQITIASLPGVSSLGVTSVSSANAAITVTDPTSTVVLTSVAYSGGANIGHVPTGSGSSASVYLDGTGNWSTPVGTTYSVMGSGNSYAAGLVLAGSATHSNQFLRKDGTWVTPPPGVTYTLSAPSANIIRLSDGSTNNDVSLSAGTGITLSQLAGNNIAFTNSDRGSSQNIYKNFTATTGGTAVANSNNDTLTLAAGTGITTTRSGDTITIAATGATANAGGQTPADYAVATGQDPVSANVQYFYIFTCHGNFTLSRMYWFQTSTTGAQVVTWGIYQGDLTSATLLGTGTATAVAGVNFVTISAEAGQSLALTKGTTYVIAHLQTSGNGSVACIDNALSSVSLAVTRSSSDPLPSSFPDPEGTYTATTLRPCVSLVP